MTEFDPVFGLADRAAWKKFQVKGSLLASRPRYVRERWGEDGVAAVLAALDAEHRAVFSSPILPFAWHSFTTLAAIDRAIVLGPMGGNSGLMKDFGTTIAHYDLPTLYKMLLKIGSPSFILKRVGTVYGTYVRGGSIAARDVRDKSGTIVLSDGSFPLYFCSQGIPGWFRAALELSGAGAADVTETECVHRGGRRCTWAARWT